MGGAGGEHPLDLGGEPRYIAGAEDDVDVRIMRGDTLLSDLSVRIAVVDSETKRPKKIPEDILKAFEA